MSQHKMCQWVPRRYLWIPSNNFWNFAPKTTWRFSNACQHCFIPISKCHRTIGQYRHMWCDIQIFSHFWFTTAQIIDLFGKISQISTKNLLFTLRKMADLDDFFAKKDRKKGKSKKLTPSEELARKIEDTSKPSQSAKKIGQDDDDGVIVEEPHVSVSYELFCLLEIKFFFASTICQRSVLGYVPWHTLEVSIILLTNRLVFSFSLYTKTNGKNTRKKNAKTIQVWNLACYKSLMMIN